MSNILGKVTGLYRFPVKSMGGEALDAILFDKYGIMGDRTWTVRDAEKGVIAGGKKYPDLMKCDARFTEEPTPDTRSAAVEITLPDGETISGADPDVSTKISAAIGDAVNLSPLMPEDELEHYLRDPSAMGDEAALRAVFARLPDEPLPNLLAYGDDVLKFESPPGTHFDAFPLLLMSQAGMDAVQARNADSLVDVRRFRPNLLIDGPGEGHIEADWVGKTVRLGEAVLKMEILCPRCVMTTHPFQDLPKDPAIMRSVVQETGGDLGINASVLEAGTVRLGDELVVIDG